MPATSIEREIHARVESFVEDLAELIRAAALESVRDALGGAAAPAAAVGAPARPRRKKVAKRKASKRKATRSGKRVRRSAQEVELLGQAVEAVVLANPGIGLGDIARAMGEDVKDIRRPTQVLMAAGKLRSEGERRGTKYFPGGGKRKAAKKKASKKRKTTKRKTAKRKTAKRKTTGKRAKR